MKKNKIKRAILSVFISIFVIILTITLPFVGVKNSDDLHNIFSVFVGERPEYQGIIEVWNIDTFDGGSASKSSYLNLVAKAFEKKNKGIYVMIKNLSEYECINLIQKGYYPDLFSCSYGVASEIKDYIVPFLDVNDININEKLLNAGKIGNDAYGLAWCYGYYLLISSKNHLKNAGFYNKFGVEENSEFKLSDYAGFCGYEKQKPAKIITSLTYGINKYLLPKYALYSYNNKGLNNSLDFAIDETVNNSTSYDAYTKFLSGASVMLLGTQRDEVRINGRVESGKLDGVIMEKITSFTDLIQYIFLAKGDNYSRQKASTDFVKLIFSAEYQSKLYDIKLCSTIDNKGDNSDTMSHITSDFISNCMVNNVFIAKSEIYNLQ